jgi:hypothetical protein
MSQVKDGKSSIDAAKEILGLIESQNTPIEKAGAPAKNSADKKSVEKDLLKMSESIENKKP